MPDRVAPAFRLERILQHKHHIEELRQQELAELQALFHHQYQVLTELQGKQREGMAYLEAMQHSGLLDLATFTNALAYLNHLALSIEKQARVVHDLLQKADKKRAELVAAAKERRILEKLKTRQGHLWEQHQKREEAKTTDEIATQQFLRSQQS